MGGFLWITEPLLTLWPSNQIKEGVVVGIDHTVRAINLPTSRC